MFFDQLLHCLLLCKHRSVEYPMFSAHLACFVGEHGATSQVTLKIGIAAALEVTTLSSQEKHGHKATKKYSISM